MRYPVVLLDVGETLVGPAEPFGSVYARVLSQHGIDLTEDRLQASIADTAKWSMRVKEQFSTAKESADSGSSAKA